MYPVPPDAHPALAHLSWSFRRSRSRHESLYTSCCVVYANTICLVSGADLSHAKCMIVNTPPQPPSMLTPLSHIFSSSGLDNRIDSDGNDYEVIPDLLPSTETHIYSAPPFNQWQGGAYPSAQLHCSISSHLQR